MKNIIIFIGIFISINVLSQTVKNSEQEKCKLIDGETKQAVPYANICFEGLQKHNKMYTTSGLDGSFANFCKETSVIAISFIGYKTIIDTLMFGETKTYIFTPDVFNLDQVVVTATRTNKTLKDAPVITQVISAKQIESRGLTTVESVLETDIPGLDFQKVGFGTDINMQGLSSKNILILIDGERMAGENGNNVDYSRLNTNNIERIEIVKGASSALYGSQAMGGVINIITKKPRKKIEFSFGGKLTEMNQINFHDTKINDDDYNFKHNLDLPNTNYNATIGFNLNKFSGKTSFVSKSSDAYKLQSTDTMFLYPKNVDTVLVYSDGANINGFTDYTIEQLFSYTPNKKIEANIKASYYNHNEYDFVPDNKYQIYEDFTINGNVKYKFNNDANIAISMNRDEYRKYDYLEKLEEKRINYNNIFLNPKLVGTFKIYEKHTITTGTEYLNESLLSDKYTYDTLAEKQVNTSVLFIQDDINFTDKINVIAGLRTDYHSAFGLNISPKLSAMYKYKNHSFRVNYAKGFRAPNLKELYMEWTMPALWFTIKGDKNLQPETNNYLSLSSEYSKNNLNGSINIYKNWFKNKIEGEWHEHQTIYQYVNVASSELTGIELLLKYRLFKHFSFSGGYSFVHDERSSEAQMSTISPHSANMRFEFNLRKGIYNTNISLSGKITGAKNYEYSESINYRGKDIDAVYDVHYNAFSLWNLTISQQIYNATNIILGVNNIFNYKAPIISSETPMTVGRRVFMSVQINVDKFFNN